MAASTQYVANVQQEVDGLLDYARIRGIGVDSPQFRAWLHGDSLVDPALAVTTSTAWSSNWAVRKGIDVLCRMIGWLPFQVVRGTGKAKTIVANHWLPALMKKPNPFLTSFQVWAFTIAHMYLFGESFWWLFRGARQQPTELWLVDPRWMVPVVDWETNNGIWPLVGWEIMVRGRRFATLDVADVLHFKHLNPFSMWRGASPLESVGLSIAADIEANKYNVAFFRKGAKIGGVLQTDKPLQPDKADDVRRKFIAMNRDAASIAVLWGGMKYEPVASTHTDMQFIEGKNKMREEILACLGIPPVVIGVMDGATYANANQQVQLLWEITGIPLMRLLCDTIDPGMLSREAGLSSEFDLTGIKALRDDYDKLSQIFQRFMQYGMPYNETTELLDLRVKRQKWGDVSLLPFNVVTADSVVNPEPDPAATQPTSPNAGDQPANTGDTTVNALGAHVDRAIESLGAAERYFRIEEQIIVARATGVVGDKVVRVRGLADELIQDIILSIGEDADKLSALARPYYDRFFEMGGVQMGDMLGVSFDVADYPEAIDFLKTKAIKIKDVNDTVKEHVRAQLLDGLTKGESTEELADRVRAVYNFATYRSRTIARTEASSTVNAARHMVQEGQGVEMTEWVTAGDERVRESHSEEDGNQVAIGEPYPVTGLLYPGDPAGAAEEIINCRCLELPVLDEARMARLRERSARDLYWRTISYQYGRQQRAFETRLRKFFNAQRKKVLPLVAKLKA